MLNISAISSAPPVPRPAKVPEKEVAPGVAPGAEPEAPFNNVLIARMREQADLTDEAKLPRGAERKLAVYTDLVATAEKSQAGAMGKLAELKEQGLVDSFESMFLPNAIIVKSVAGKHAAVADALKAVADIQEVSENKTWSVKAPTEPKSAVTDAIAGAVEVKGGGIADPAPDAPAPDKPKAEAPKADEPPADAAGLEWGVKQIGADKAWAKGIDGTGITVGIVDTGLDAEHPAIKPHYRGTNKDGTQSHDYNWFDPVGFSPKPVDDGEHGTHVAGTTAGGDATHGIGVAPGAKIIAAKAILGNGFNTTEATLKALQFMLAPTDVKGKNPDPTKGADVVNNSWGNANKDDKSFVETWNGLLAAGIEPISAAGNDGPGPGTISPPGSYPMGISVAATNSADKVTSFSSRGPSKFDPKAILPHVAAPGASVNSSVPGGGYARNNGTSMASPHVAGAVAMLLQAAPQASHDQILKALTDTATDIDAKGPDLSAGYGRINVDQAIDALKAMTAAPASPAAGGGTASTPPADGMTASERF